MRNWNAGAEGVRGNEGEEKACPGLWASVWEALAVEARPLPQGCTEGQCPSERRKESPRRKMRDVFPPWLLGWLPGGGVSLAGRGLCREQRVPRGHSAWAQSKFPRMASFLTSKATNRTSWNSETTP